MDVLCAKINYSKFILLDRRCGKNLIKSNVHKNIFTLEGNITYFNFNVNEVSNLHSSCREDFVLMLHSKPYHHYYANCVFVPCFRWSVLCNALIRS
jgi:hypothetical protein